VVFPHCVDMAANAQVIGPTNPFPPPLHFLSKPHLSSIKYYDNCTRKARADFEEKCVGFLWRLLSSPGLLDITQAEGLPFKIQLLELQESKSLLALSFDDDIATFRALLNLALLNVCILKVDDEESQAWQKWQAFWNPERVQLPLRLAWTKTNERSIVRILAPYADILRLVCGLETQNIIKILKPILDTLVNELIIPSSSHLIVNFVLECQVRSSWCYAYRRLGGVA